MRRQNRGNSEWPPGQSSSSRTLGFSEAHEGVIGLRERYNTGQALHTVGDGAQAVRQEDKRSNAYNGRDESRLGTQDFSGRSRITNCEGGFQPKGAVKSRRDSEEHRHWIYSKREHLPSEERFVIVSYNILGVDNAFHHWHELYYHIPPFIMNWDHRKRRLLQEIGLWSPDVLCLQEVDRFEEIQEELGQRQYLGIFQGRTGVASDGCAIFWRKKRFSLLHAESIEYKDLDLRDNVAQLCILQGKRRKFGTMKRRKAEEIGQPRSRLLVCNIHVLFNPNRGDIKIGQVRVLLERAHNLSEEWGGIPVVITGDFNSTPQSAIYQFLSSSELDVLCFDRRRMSGQLGVEIPYSKPRSSDQILQRMPINESNKLGLVAPVMSEQGLHPKYSDNLITRSIGARHKTLGSEDYVAMEIQEEAFEGESEHMFQSRSQLDSVISEKCQMQDFRMAINEFTVTRAAHWSLDELKAATGSSELTSVQHAFKLQSAYSVIEAPIDKRDSVGEPLVTTYHRKFLGTVDYIWYTEGLYPIKVLDILPLNVLKKTGGLPSKKWGSDHLALACELAFSASYASESSEQVAEDRGSHEED